MNAARISLFAHFNPECGISRGCIDHGTIELYVGATIRPRSVWSAGCRWGSLWWCWSEAARYPGGAVRSPCGRTLSVRWTPSAWLRPCAPNTRCCRGAPHRRPHVGMWTLRPLHADWPLADRGTGERLLAAEPDTEQVASLRRSPKVCAQLPALGSSPGRDAVGALPAAPPAPSGAERPVERQVVVGHV